MGVILKVDKKRDTMKKEPQSIADVLKNRIPQPKKKTGGATYKWQDHAVRVATKLNIQLDKQWFKCFRENTEGLLERTASWVDDYSCTDKKMMFYWGLNQFKKHGKIIGTPEGR